jgi:aspartate/methionine/tyrosine aminotransferase
VSSVTKLHGLRTIRIGWLIGPPIVARRVEEARLISSYRLPVLSCRYAAEAVRRQEWFRERFLDRARENLPVLTAWTQTEERVAITPPQGALMVLVRLPPAVDDLAFSEALLEKGVGVGPGRYWGVPGAIRVTFSCPRPQFEEGLAAISSALDIMTQ